MTLAFDIDQAILLAREELQREQDSRAALERQQAERQRMEEQAERAALEQQLRAALEHHVGYHLIDDLGLTLHIDNRSEPSLRHAFGEYYVGVRPHPAISGGWYMDKYLGVTYGFSSVYTFGENVRRDLLLAWAEVRDAEAAERAAQAAERQEQQRRHRERQEREERVAQERQERQQASIAEDMATRQYILAEAKACGRWEWPEGHSITVHRLTWDTGDGMDYLWSYDEAQPDEHGYITGWVLSIYCCDTQRSVKLDPSCKPVWERLTFNSLGDLPSELTRYQEIKMYGVQSPFVQGLGRCYRRIDNREKWESIYFWGDADLRRAIEPHPWLMRLFPEDVYCLNHDLTLADLEMPAPPDPDAPPF